MDSASLDPFADFSISGLLSDGLAGPEEFKCSRATFNLRDCILDMFDDLACVSHSSLVASFDSSVTCASEFLMNAFIWHNALCQLIQ